MIKNIFQQCKPNFVLTAVLVLLFTAVVRAEDGYRLWLRYDKISEKAAKTYRSQIKTLIVKGDSKTVLATRNELETALEGLLGGRIPVAENLNNGGALIVGTPQNSPLIAGLKIERELIKLGSEGFIIRSVKIKNRKAIVIASSGETGALYGAFHFLRLLQNIQPVDKLNISEKPKLHIRMLDHWDNLDGSVERGYAGKSLWNWAELPEKIDPRLIDYARANASVGINGAAINNVNADARILTPDYLKKVAAIADIFRPYGIKVYLSARFSAPIELGGLETADPFSDSRFRRLSGQSEQRRATRTAHI